MRPIACTYAGVARNWLRRGVLKHHRVIYGRQFEIDSEDDVLVSVPSTDLFIDENKKLLADPSMFNYMKTGMICGDDNSIKYRPESSPGNHIEEELPPNLNESPPKYPEEETPHHQNSEDINILSHRVFDLLICQNNFKPKTDFERRLI